MRGRVCQPRSQLGASRGDVSAPVDFLDAPLTCTLSPVCTNTASSGPWDLGRVGQAGWDPAWQAMTSDPISGLQVPST